MKKYLILIAALALLCASCKEQKFIPKGDMVGIMYDCFLIDRCLDENLEFRAQADTTMTYLPVIEKYGYTREEFIESLQHYLSVPKEMNEIYKATSKLMEQRCDELQAIVDGEIINVEEKFTDDNMDPEEAARIEEERAAKEKLIQEQDNRGRKKMKGKKVRDKKNNRDITINEEGAPIVETSVNF